MGMQPRNQEKRVSDIVETLLGAGLMANIIASPHGSTYERCIREGKEIPDELLPGRFILSCTPEQRKLLSQLTPKDFDHRLDFASLYMRRRKNY